MGKLIWKNLNKLTERNNDQRTKEPELKVTHDPDMIASTFNKFFINSVEELAQSFSFRTIAYTPINNTKPGQ